MRSIRALLLLLTIALAITACSTSSGTGTDGTGTGTGTNGTGAPSSDGKAEPKPAEAGAQPADGVEIRNLEFYGNDALTDLIIALGGDRRPSRAIDEIREVHNPNEFTHRIKVEDAAETCREAIRDLRRSSYKTWEGTAIVVRLLSKMSELDASALSRSECIFSLATMGGWIRKDAEGLGAAVETNEEEMIKAVHTLDRLRKVRARPIPSKDLLDCVHAITVLASHPWYARPIEDPSVLNLSRPRSIILYFVHPLMDPFRQDLVVRDTLDRALLRLMNTVILMTEVVALGDRVAFVRNAAAKALMSVGDPDTLPALAWAYQREEHATVKLSLIEAMGAIGSTRDAGARLAARTLVAALLDHDASVRGAAARELGRVTGLDLGPDPGAWLRWWSESGREFMRR